MKNIDEVLKELSDLYEFNREIQRFSFKYPEGHESSERVYEKTTHYETRNTH